MTRQVPQWAAFVAFAILFLGFYVMEAYFRALPEAISWIVHEGVLMVGLPVAVPLLLGVPLKDALKLRLPTGGMRVLWITVASVVTIGFYYYFTFLLSRFSIETRRMIQSDAYWMFQSLRQLSPAILVILALYIAFAEELFFRGLVLGALEGRWRALPACMICGLMFSVVHMSIGKFVPVFLAGVWFSYVTLRGGSMWMGVIAHFLLNAAGFALAVSMQHVSPEVVQKFLAPPVWPLAIFLPLMAFIIFATERIFRETTVG